MYSNTAQIVKVRYYTRYECDTRYIWHVNLTLVHIGFQLCKHHPPSLGQPDWGHSDFNLCPFGINPIPMVLPAWTQAEALSAVVDGSLHFICHDTRSTECSERLSSKGSAPNFKWDASLTSLLKPSFKTGLLYRAVWWNVISRCRWLSLWISQTHVVLPVLARILDYVYSSTTFLLLKPHQYIPNNWAFKLTSDLIHVEY